MHATFFIILSVSLLVAVNSAFYKVVYESCDEMSNAKKFFDGFLLPCATYNYHPGDLTCLSAAEADLAASTLPDWNIAKDETSGLPMKLNRTFTFSDFRHAFLFMSEAAQLAETNQHHPSWTNSYNVIDVTLTTDDKACLSTFDVELAHGMDYVYVLANKQ